MPPTAKKQFGNLGETIAANYLKDKDYVVIAMNYANPSGRRLGEIDIIAEDRSKNEIVFVEVKAREMLRYSHTLPEENVDWRKRQRLERIAYYYLKENNLLDRDYRFDVMAIWIDQDLRRAKVKHIPSI